MAEKFSRFRDAGTGIQVFLTPVPPASSASTVSYLLPVTLVSGLLRSILIALFAGVWAMASQGATLGCGNRYFARTILILLGFYGVREEKMSLRSRGRATTTASSIVFSPQKGDIIVSNLTSWTDLLYLTARFSPVFVLPIVSASSQPQPIAGSSSATSTGPGSGSTMPRRGTPKKNAMSANTRIETPGLEQKTEVREVKGFRRAGLWEMIRRSGYAPLIEGVDEKSTPLRLDQIAESAKAPVVVFPELVTSNNRGLLRFSTVFPSSWRLLYRRSGSLQIGAGQAKLHILSFKHDPPSTLLPTTTLSVPTHLTTSGTGWNPLAHVWSLVNTLPVPRGLTVRLLDPSESPSGSQYLADPAAVNVDVLDPLADACAGLVANLSRLRRTNLGWEDKEAFLAMMRSRR